MKLPYLILVMRLLGIRSDRRTKLGAHRSMAQDRNGKIALGRRSQLPGMVKGYVRCCSSLVHQRSEGF